jgi:hypothetical protein
MTGLLGALVTRKASRHERDALAEAAGWRNSLAALRVHASPPVATAQSAAQYFGSGLAILSSRLILSPAHSA